MEKDTVAIDIALCHIEGMKKSVAKRKAVVLLSGGLDSTTVLAHALAEDFACYALSFDYGQRSHSELAAAKRVAQHYCLPQHFILRLELDRFGHSALTDTAIAVPTKPTAGVPITYVPARNTVFLSHALAWAEVLQARDIFTGVNHVDYSGYPDCRPEYLQAFEKMANLATRSGIAGESIRIQAPLLELSKAEIIHQGISLSVDYALTVSCYQADAEGVACGQCDSCRFRRQGFADAGVTDPTVYQPQPK